MSIFLYSPLLAHTLFKLTDTRDFKGWKLLASDNTQCAVGWWVHIILYESIFYFFSFCIIAACQPLEVTCKCVHFNPSVRPFVMRNSSNVSLCCHFFAKIFDGISSLSSLHPLSYSSPQNVCFFPTLQMESDFVLLPLDVILSLCIMMGVGIKT